MPERNKEELIMKSKTKLARLCSILLTLVMMVGYFNADGANGSYTYEAGKAMGKKRAV